MALAGAEATIEPASEPVEPERKRRLRLTPYLLLLPGIAWLAIFFVWPMFTLAKTSLSSQDLAGDYVFSWHFQTYKDAFSLYHSQFVRSFIYAAIATASALAISFPLAYTIAFKSGKWKNLLLVLVIAPFFTSFLIRTLAWQTILADNGISGFLIKAADARWNDADLACLANLELANFEPVDVSGVAADLTAVTRNGTTYQVPLTTYRTVATGPQPDAPTGLGAQTH